MALINPLLGSNLASTGFDSTLIGNSVWLDGSADFLHKELGAKTRTRAVIGCWIQKTGFTTSDATIFSKKGTAQFALRMQDQSSKGGKISIFDYDGSAMQYEAESTSMVLRDNAWYHIMISIDTGASAGSRLKYYINGIDQTSTLTVSTDYTASDNPSITGGSGEPTHWGVGYGGTSQFIPAYLSQCFLLDDDSIQNSDVGVSDILESFSFGDSGSQFGPRADSKIAALATAAGGHSFCLDFANSSALGNDIGDEENDFSVTSMSAANQTTSSPSSAFCIWNPLRVNTQTQTFAEGSLRFSSTQTSTNPAATGNYGVSSGKWYWEVYVVAQGNTSNMLGICDVEAGLEADTTALYASALMYSYEFAGTKRNNNSSASYGASISNGDIVGIALDMDNGGVYFSKNGTFQASGDPTSGSSLTNAAFTGLNSAGSGTFQPYYLAYSNGDGVANFGQSPTFNGQTTAGGNTDANGKGNFKYSVPSEYTALTSSNLPAPEFFGVDHFQPIIYTGNGSARSISTDINPGLVWIKNRPQGDGHKLVDSVRGATKEISSSSTAIQATDSNGVTAFGTKSFNLGSGANGYNDNTENFVAWVWEADTAFSNDASETSVGNHDSAGRVSSSGAFSITSFTGSSGSELELAHGLGGVPEMIFVKNLAQAGSNWAVYHKHNGNTKYMLLQDGMGVPASGNVNYWHNTTPISSIFTVGSGGTPDTNGNGQAMIAYCFRSVPGVCKVGHYFGNQDANGPYIGTGFQPSLVMMKWVSGGSLSSEGWIVKDTARAPTNENRTDLYWSSTGTEGTGSTHGIDILSAGFRLKGTGGANNISAGTYLYLALGDLQGGGTLPPIYGR